MTASSSEPIRRPMNSAGPSSAHRRTARYRRVPSSIRCGAQRPNSAAMRREPGDARAQSDRRAVSARPPHATHVSPQPRSFSTSDCDSTASRPRAAGKRRAVEETDEHRIACRSALRRERCGWDAYFCRGRGPHDTVAVGRRGHLRRPGTTPAMSCGVTVTRAPSAHGRIRDVRDDVLNADLLRQYSIDAS
jgi:hypothetical protein